MPMMGLAISLFLSHAGAPAGVEPVNAHAPACTHADHVCAAEQLGSGGMFDRVIDRLAAESADPQAARRRLVDSLVRANACYALDITETQFEAIMRRTLMRPPGSVKVDDRFVSDHDNVDPNEAILWVGDLGLQPKERGERARLTYSFPPDGITWGDMDSGFSTAPNALNASLTGLWGASDLDEGREYIRQALAQWRKYGGLTYDEVGDDGLPMDDAWQRSSVRGDIRIGGIPLSVNGVLAYNAFPTIGGLGVIGGGDMVINTSYFTTANHFAASANDYRYFRNTVTHEHGHGLGYIHVIPCTQTKIMEPQITTSVSGLTVDERRGLVSNYGDRFSGNYSFATAANLGNLTSPIQRSDIERDLGLNPVGTPNNSDEDFFSFTLGTAQTVTINADPTGGSYTNDQQSTGCNGMSGTPVPTINADQAGNPALYLYNSSQVQIASSTAGAPGVTETITQNLAAGTYYIRVVNDGNANPLETSANKLVQLYDLEVRVGTALASPWAVAGLNKRVAANTNCFFNGAANSQAVEPGATIPNFSYEWDLDGDGTFETQNNARPSRQYVSNGVYNVTLRITDSNGMQDTDTITVTVVGATGGITQITPSSGARNSVVPITITGTNLKNASTLPQFFVQGGTGVTISGTPVPNALGTSITGLSLIISNTASLGARDLSIVNADGMGATVFGPGLFTVTSGVAPPANDECTGAASWGNTTGAKTMNNNGATNSALQSFPSTGCPASGPINNDVWYSWVCPTTGTLSVTNNSVSQGFDSRIAVYSGACPASGGTLLGCDDFGASVIASVTAGTTYYFRCGSVTSNVTGSATVTLTVAEPTGACCTGTACTVTTASLCGGSFQGVGVPCGSFSNPTTCCPANFNGTGGVSVADLFAFLDAWFLQFGSVGPGFSADFQKDNDVDVADLFGFLDAWFLGC